MKLSSNTLAILTNFSTINSSILIRPGNVLRTISIAEDVSASATIEENFEHEFAIYDLPQFLKGIKLYNQPEIEISDDSNFALIKYQNHTIKYLLTPTDLVFAPENRNIRIPSKDVEFEMRYEHFDKLMKAANVFTLSDFTIVGNGKEIILQVRNKADPTSNEVSTIVGETKNNFELNFDRNNLLMIPGHYDVVISKEMVSQFINQDFELVYTVGLCSDSTFED